MDKELELRKEWLAKARKQTLETLPDFINNILNNNPMSYNLAPYAVGVIASAAAWAVNDKIGLTGFQAGFAMWAMIEGWLGESRVGKELIDYENMLYPQYEDYYKARNDTIDSDRFLAHQINILRGKVPFGYTIED